MIPHLADGWLVVPYSGPEMTTIEVGVQHMGADPEWFDAFLGYENGERVAKIRPPELGRDPVAVLVRVGGSGRFGTVKAVGANLVL